VRAVAAQPQVMMSAAPRTLYHYTSATGLLGILESRSLWATSIHQLNDATELQHALVLTRLYLASFRPKPGQHLGHDAWLHEAMMTGLDQLARINVFVFSLSAERDLLSQWRAYCPEGGYALGFGLGSLRTLARRAGLLLEPCCYEPTEKNRIIREVVDKFIADWKARAPTKPDANIAMDAALDFGEQIVRVGPLLKHTSFAEEREWRLFSPPTRIDDQRLGFRARGPRIVSHLDVSLESLGPTVGLDEIVVGPMDGQGLAMDSLLSLTVNRKRQVQIGRSESPYRIVPQSG
jgi:hypothetical protein